jgi:hypothetical protein
MRHNDVMGSRASSDRYPPDEESRCLVCKHLVEWPYCFAFLTGEGIPEEIRTGQVDHTLPYPGDHGITFSPQDSPYHLSEEGMKDLLCEYKGQTIMPSLAEGAYADDESDYEIRAGGAMEFATDLMTASARGDVAAVKRFLRAGVDINMRDAYGHTALMHACRHCQPEVVRLLLDEGADLDARDRYFRTALDIAFDWGYPSIVEMLKSHSAKQLE